MKRINLDSLTSQKIPSTWPRGLLTFIVIVFLLTVGTVMGLKYWNGHQQAYLSSLSQELKTLRESFSSEEQGKVALFEKKINVLKELLKQHIYFSQDLALLESLTHPQVYYTNLTFNPDNNSLALQGVAKDQSVLSEAISGLINDPQEVKAVALHTVKVGTNKSASFVLDIFLQPSILHYHSESAIVPIESMPSNE